MTARRTKSRNTTHETGEHHRQTPTFLLELPLAVNEGQESFCFGLNEHDRKRRIALFMDWKGNHHEISAHLWWHQQRQHSQRSG